MRAGFLCALLFACTGETGTIRVEVITAPGSTLLDDVYRVELDAAGVTATAERENGGPLALRVEPPGTDSGLVALRGFSAAGELIAVGQSAPLPFVGLDTDIRIFVAPPLSFSPAPSNLPVARSGAGTDAIFEGALVVGGRDVSGQVVSAVNIYNAYTHTWEAAPDLPVSQTGVTVLSIGSGQVYLIGGENQAGVPQADLRRLDTRQGVYLERDFPMPRAAPPVTALGFGDFAIGGGPPLRLVASTGQVTEEAGPALFGAAATRFEEDRAVAVYIGQGTGVGGAALYDGTSFAEISAPATAQRTGHSAVALGERLLFAGGANRTALVWNDAFTEIAEFLTVPRTHAAIAATERFVIVAGGEDNTGAPLATADVFDRSSLALVATVPLAAPRRFGRLVALPTDQLLLVGGLGADGNAVEVSELFTP